MDTNTSGEELLTKTRKPYTITKQRERWTEDEHNRFLEALKLYGRAWQQIEEHIGTKTAVQIRSHAQKFFTKLEKEAEAKGVPVSKALDIEIPPPRPKRKPNTPYPRKNGASSSQLSSAKDAKLMSSSASSSHLNQTFLDLEKMPSSDTFMESANNETNKTSNVDKDVPKKNKDRDGNDITMQSYSQNHPSGMVSQDFMREEEIHKHTTTSYTTASHHSQDYNSFLQISSTFSNLIMSTLLQNPAAHAAATFAASVWPYANSGDSSMQSSSSPPSLAAIAAATVAAATAWWASHGLLPVCTPTPPVTCVPFAVPTPVINKVDTDQLPLEKQNTALQDQNKSPGLSSDDSEATGITKLNDGIKANGEKVEEVVVADSQKKRPVDRSSCGSNTPSGSDAETDALDKMEKDKEDDVKEIDPNQSSILELSNRRSKTRDNNNPTTDSWKEVSEEGRIAFQALFARERLPQSFSPPQVAGKQSETSNPLATNLKMKESCDADQESVVMVSVGSGKSYQTRQTGFKPYKRCSMEVKESQVGNTNNQSDEKVCKRLRLEGEAST